MTEVQIEDNFDDEALDGQYFNLMHQFLIDYRDRYNQQTSQLLDSKIMTVEIQGSKLRFSLTPLGCSYSTIESDVNIKSEGWVRMGWRRASKRQALPRFFARAEASLILNSDLD